MKKAKKTLPARLAAAAFWLALWQWAAMAVGQEVFLVSPLRALATLARLLPTADFWGRVAFSSGRILLGFGLGCVCSAALAVAARLSRPVNLTRSSRCNSLIVFSSCSCNSPRPAMVR